MSKLGQLVIELAANTARLQSDMGKAVGIVETGARKMSGAFRALGVAGGGGVLAAVLGNSVKQAIKLGDELQKASIKAGIGGKEISELAYAAKLADVELAGLSTAIKKMQVSLSEAGTGAKGPLLALSALGLEVDKLQKLKADEQFTVIGDRISQLKDPADRARAAVELFGKAGADLLPLFEKGAQGIAKAREEARALGLAFNDEQLKKLGDADDAMKRLNASWEGFFVTLSAKVAPTLSFILDGLSGIDSRPLVDRLDEEIRQSALRVDRLNSGLDFLPSDQRDALEKNLELLRARRALLDAPKLSDPGQRGASGAAIGFGAAQDLSELEELQGEFVGITADQYQTLYDDIGRMRDEALAEDLDREVERLQFYKDAELERQELAEEVAAFNREQAEKLSEGAQIFKDTLMKGWDDWVHNGKIRVDEMVKYMVLAFAQRGLAAGLDSMFSGGTFGGGFMGFLGGLFGGGRAAGGPVQAGKFYRVGENGPEIIAAGAGGTVIPNHAMGGGSSIVIHNSIDARGASMDLIKALPGILDQNSRATEARIVERLSRGSYRALN